MPVKIELSPLTITLSPGHAIADFNMVDERGRLDVSRSTYRGFGLERGRLVELRDHEGNRCQAEVEAVRAKTIVMRPFLSSWQDAPQHRATAPRDVFVARVSTVNPATSAEVAAG